MEKAIRAGRWLTRSLKTREPFLRSDLSKTPIPVPMKVAEDNRKHRNLSNHALHVIVETADET
jgi:hypothetical protein